nr:ribonuclease H-like domain-containing protein [Tanacetum cinerariifolium]
MYTSIYLYRGFVNNNPPSPPVNIEKPFGVINIKSHVTLVLNLDQLNYDAWCELFTSHCHNFGVHGLLDGTFVCTSDNATEWKKLDSLVKNVWKSLKDLFHDNKEARAMELHEELRSLELCTLFIVEYFKRIKESRLNRKQGRGHARDRPSPPTVLMATSLLPYHMLLMLPLFDMRIITRTQGGIWTSVPLHILARMQDYQTRHLLLRCDSTGDLYPFHSSTGTTMTTLFSSNQSTWHQILRDPDDDVLSISLWPETSPESMVLARIISFLHAKFAMTDLGPLNYFLGIAATCTSDDIFLSQTKYATEILERAHMLNCNRTPVDTEKKLGPEGSPVADPTFFRSPAGALQYLTFTPPALSYAVQQLCLYMHDPREPYFHAMKRVLRYLRGTTDLGLYLFRSSTSQLTTYSDADWTGCPATRRSISSYCIFLGDNLVTWSSKHQETLSRSSAEAEYRGLQMLWLRHLGFATSSASYTQHFLQLHWSTVIT